MNLRRYQWVRYAAIAFIVISSSIFTATLILYLEHAQ